MPLSNDLPADGAYEVTQHNTTAQDCTRGIYIGVGGDLKVTTIDGDTVTFKDAPQGSIIPVRAVVIFDDGTAATDLVGLT